MTAASTSATAPTRQVLPIKGMTCAACVAHVEKALATLDCVVTAVEWGHGKRKGQHAGP